MNFPFAANEGFETAEPLSRGRSERSISLHELWAVFYRSRLWIAAIIAACVLAGVVYSLLATRLYQASSSIEVRQEAEKVLGTEADREGAASRADGDRFLQTQLDIIRSRGVATAVAQTLGLFRGDEFLARMGITPDDAPRPGLSAADNRREQVIQALQKNLAVQYTGNTRIAELRFTSPDAGLAMQVANAYGG